MAGKKLIEVLNGGGAAWRARYVHVRGRQWVSFGIDPNHGTWPQAFGNVGRWSFRFGLPRVAWRYPMSPARSVAYRLSSRFWHNMDGRVGWGSEYRKQKAAEERQGCR